MIAIDWGTTNFRGFRIRAGHIIDKVSSGPGISMIPPAGFPAALRTAIGAWLEDGERHVLMAGMVGSRQGWVEAPYLPCPADAMDLAMAAIRVPFEGADVRLIPGLTASDTGGTPEVMRGEEAQLAGILHHLRPQATVCLPGSHSKWVRIIAGRIDGFATHMTGEAFAAMRHHTILGRLMTEAPHDDHAFRRGVDRSADAGGLLHHLFGVRTLGLFDQLSGDNAASFLSGLLIGHEIRAASPRGPVHLVGSHSLTSLYAAAIDQTGGDAIILNEDAAAAGLWRLSEHIEWT
jgi:2-dehydro-3-deoxygalactonokinase